VAAVQAYRGTCTPGRVHPCLRAAVCVMDERPILVTITNFPSGYTMLENES
jgi:hypothetical protein